MRYLQSALIGALIYVCVLGSINPWDWLFGLAFGLLTGSFVSRALRGRALLPLARFGVGYGAFVLSGSLRVLRLLLRRQPRSSGELSLEAGQLNGSSRELLAFAATSAPGTALVHYTTGDRVMLFNVVDQRDGAAVRQDLEDFYRRYQAPLARAQAPREESP